MNILRIIASMNPATGGPCEGIRNSIPELKYLGINNEVVCLDDPEISFHLKDAFVVHALGRGKGPWCYHPDLIGWLLKNLHRFDVVIIHGIWLYPSYAAAKALKFFKKQRYTNGEKKHHVPKLYIMPHGMLDPYFQRDPGRKLKALRNIIYWKLIESKVINNADGLLFTCEEELQLARQTFRPYKPKREINVSYGIKKPPFFFPKMNKEFLKLCPDLKGCSYLLFLGRLHEKKGIDILIQAYSVQLNKSLRKGNSIPKLVIAGPGMHTSYGNKIQHLINQNPDLKNYIILPGLLTGNAKWGAYYGCEAFILPSHQENFGIAVVEALACCKPVFISNKVNIWHEIKNAKAGIVMDDTIEGTLQSLELWENMSNEEKQAMGRSAGYTFEKNFTAASAAAKLFKVINN